MLGGFTLLLAGLTPAFAQELKPIPLPRPQMDGGKPLMQALKERKSTRAFSSEKLSPQILGNLLWAAFGINRPDTGQRTAPSAVNWQEIDVYVATADGLYLYDAKGHALLTVLTNDVRALTGMQPFVKDAPVTLVFVSDFAKMGTASAEDKKAYAHVDVGYISQNVYLYCASAGLVTGARAMVDRTALAPKLKLRADQVIILAQSVGYAPKS